MDMETSARMCFMSRFLNSVLSILLQGINNNVKIDSSKIKAVQRVGRVCRAQENKQAEIFNLVINDTAETEWFKKAHAKSQYTTIDEQGLEAVLNYEEPKPYKKKIPKLTFRF